MAGERPVVVGLNAVIVAVTEEQPRILTIQRPDPLVPVEPGAEAGRTDALPFGPLDPTSDRTLERGLRGWVREQTGLGLGYVEQLYTFGDRNRDPTGLRRVVSVAYLALVREARPSGASGAEWRNVYQFFPWEDWRAGRPEVIDRAIAPVLEGWVETLPPGATRRERRERAEISFGLGGVGWDGERVLERYELLYEVGLVAEAARDRRLRRARLAAARRAAEKAPRAAGGVAPEVAPAPPGEVEPERDRFLGLSLAADHRRILATALGRLRGKLKYRPVVFELLAPSFTLLGLQRVVESLAGVQLHKQNFRRLVETGGLVEGTGKQDAQTGGRPAELFRFRREVLRERPAPGVGLPGLRVG